MPPFHELKIKVSGVLDDLFGIQLILEIGLAGNYLIKGGTSGLWLLFKDHFAIKATV